MSNATKNVTAEDLAADVIGSNQALRRAESDARIAKTAAMEHVAATLTETFKLLKPLADLSDNEAFAAGNIRATLLRFWENAR